MYTAKGMMYPKDANVALVKAKNDVTFNGNM